ncbi:sporozoite micronemal protein essential for cell traversal, putative [Hepatocystis sp. ex Piliocolobus tephrosceles]|nr:sporozoite micronemal protein essential for cell traversal, putative [Hepatocystis sp. ex Piliocolobus tephrosceles]
MKLMNLKKYVPLFIILFYLNNHGFINTIRINNHSTFKNNDRNNNTQDSGILQYILSENVYLKNKANKLNNLSNSSSYKNGNKKSFLNVENKILMTDDDDFDFDDDDDDSTGDTVSTASSNHSNKSSDDDLSSDNDNDDDDDDIFDSKKDDKFPDKSKKGLEEDDNKDKNKKFEKKVKFDSSEKSLNEEKKKKIDNMKEYDFSKQEEAEREETKTPKEDIDYDYNMETDPEIYEQDKMVVFPGLHYIGIGYDLLFGNPLGELNSLTDPGYRAQIYLLNWELSERGISNDLKHLQPINGWIRKENACSRAESINECSSISNYSKNLSADVSVSGNYAVFASFSASSGFKNFLEEQKKRTSKTYLVKSKCVKYTIGLPKYAPWEKTFAFSNAIKGLPVKFTGLEKDSECTSDVYEQKQQEKECVNVRTWMEFFRDYGTHIIVEAQLGGKITKVIKVSKSSIDKIKKNGLHVKAEIQAQFGFGSAGGGTNVQDHTSSNSDEESYDMSEQLIVIGGNPIKDVTKEENLFEWSKSVALNPMPVSIKLIPMSDVFHSNELKDSYKDAYTYYTRLYGNSPHDTMQKDDKNINKILNLSTTVTNMGAPPLSTECPTGQVVLFGFTIKQNYWDNTHNLKEYHIEICEAGLNNCVSKQGATNTYDVAFSYIECGEQPLPFLEQVVTDSSEIYNVGKCTNDYSILFGFGFSASSGHRDSALHTHVVSCRPGLKSCSFNMKNVDVKSYIYMACVDATVWTGLNNLSIVAKDDSHAPVNRHKPFNDGTVIVNCPEKGTILGGFYGESNTSSPRVEATFGKCIKGEVSCSGNGSGHAMGGLYNYKSLFAVALCTNNT